jgi:hypothetical protein
MLADLDKEGTKPKRKIACPDILLRACSNFPKVCKLWMLETNESGFKLPDSWMSLSSSPHTHSRWPWSYPCMQKLMEFR